MSRPFNFSPGPSTLPQVVLEQAAAQMLDYKGTGMNVMEMSHRGAVFMEIQAQAMADFRELAGVPDDYEILFLHGGAKGENAVIPLNLIGRLGANPALHKADYVNTGIWSTASLGEARKYGDVHVAATNETAQTIAGREQKAWTYVPPFEQWRLRADASYLHICGNETISGVEYFDWPTKQLMAQLGAPNVPVVNDVSSHILSRPIPVQEFGLLYGGAQKNIGISGLTFVIIRKDLIGHALKVCPSAFDYALVQKHDSMYNTPCTYAIYIAGLVFQWLKAQGGVPAMEQQNIAKANLLYGLLDSSDLYDCSIAPANRSRMNVTFFLKDESLNEAFLAESKAAGLLNLKGHKSVGGMRASIYNAMPLAGVQALVDFMRDFEKRH